MLFFVDNKTLFFSKTTDSIHSITAFIKIFLLIKRYSAPKRVFLSNALESSYEEKPKNWIKYFFLDFHVHLHA